MPATSQRTLPYKSFQAALEQLVDALQPTDDVAPQIKTIREKLATNLELDELVDILRNIANIVGPIHTQVDEERREWKVFLHQVTERLLELDRALQGTAQQSSVAFQSGQKAEVALERQFQDIESRLRVGSSVEQMKMSMQQRVAIIRARLDDSRAKKAQRFAELQGQLNTLTATVREIEQESVELRARLEQGGEQELKDPVTGIANRLAYEQRLQRGFARWKRYQSPLVLQLWEINGFETIVEKYSQKTGDNVLQLIANSMQNSLRETDFISRYGNEIFAVLLPEATLEEAQMVAERLHNAISSIKFHYRKKPVSITVSCGYADLQKGDTPQDLFERSHGALIKAQSEGSNYYRAD